MSDINKSIDWWIKIANDPAHGYDQTYRNGPDYDCSSFLGHGLNYGGFNVPKNTDTRSLGGYLLNTGFKIVNLREQIQKGDIFCKSGSHCFACIDGQNIAEASINEKGTATGGQTGDQTGREIWVHPFTDKNINGYTHYRLENLVITGDTYWSIWFGWIPNESGYKYGTKEALSRNGDKGRAYGQYQFDYRYGLIPFLKYASDAYNEFIGFKSFTSLNPGNEKLVANSELRGLFSLYANSYITNFLSVQNYQAINQYLIPAVEYINNNYGYDITLKGAVVLGSLFSMAIRSGSITAAKKYAGMGNMSAVEIIHRTYNTYGSSDAGRWLSNTSISQRDKAINALITKEDIYNLTQDGKPAEKNDSFIKTKEKKSFVMKMIMYKIKPFN